MDDWKAIDLPRGWEDSTRFQRAIAHGQATIRAENLRRTLQLLGTTCLDFDVLMLGVDPDLVVEECRRLLAEERRLCSALQGTYS